MPLKDALLKELDVDHNGRVSFNDAIAAFGERLVYWTIGAFIFGAVLGGCTVGLFR